MKPIKQFTVSARATLMLVLLLQGAFSFADDTEIFLSRGVSDVKPNVFFILDDSLSMQWCLDKDWVYPDPATKSNICPNKSYKNRFEELKWALNKLLPNMKHVNFGMMWMNRKGRVGTGLPIGDIEQVRNTALNLINTHKKPDFLETPIDRALYDAARYFNGFPANQYPGQKNFPGHSGKEPFGLNYDIPSPITDSCQPNHIVLLTDGDAWYDDIYEDIRQLIGRARWNWDKTRCVEQLGASSKNAERCVPELAQWMNSKDQMPDPLIGDQTITIHTIGLALDSIKDSDPKKVYRRKTFLNNIASSGGGNYYDADDGEKLFDSFNDILEKMAKVNNAIFVNPSAAPANPQQRIADQVYYPQFQPRGNDRWPGNLKRYRFGGVSKNGKPIYYDALDNEALDANGAFKPEAQSFWSDTPDGPNVALGGAASQLPEPSDRHLFVEIDGNLSALNNNNLAISKERLGAADDDERKSLLNYIQGFTDDGDPRDKTLGDFMHSAPVPFSYGTAETDQVIILGSNEGFVHVFNRKTGVEEFAFMPGELLKNIKQIKANKASTPDKPHPYGVDNTVTVWLDDTNNNGQFDAGEHFYAYVTLRRGGQGIYALDITERGRPKLLWQIDEKNKKAKGFDRLGQSWSQPVKTKIKIGDSSEAQDVLVFAGGYDPTEDNFNGAQDAYRNDTALGNAIYIADARTGAYLWSASHSNSDLNLPDMIYSIPSSIKDVDIDNDGIADQLFVGDTGGQIWRLFIHNGESGSPLVTASGAAKNAPFAQLGQNDPQNARRFFQTPDIVHNGSGLSVNIGSGYRAHPLNPNVDDRFYSLRANLTSSPNLPLTESNLHQATRSFDNFDKEQTIKDINASQGWYLPLTIAKGEKVLSTASTAEGYVSFATYVPVGNRIGCQIMPGTNFVYRLNLNSAAPPVETMNPPAGGIGSPTTLYQPMYRKSDVIGIISGSTIVSNELGTFMCFGDTCDELHISPCDDPKGCKLYWIDLL